MDINKMTRKQFKDLPVLDDFEGYECDSIVLLPTRRHDSSGFNVFDVVICDKWKAIGRVGGYDTFSIYDSGEFVRVGFDCLRGSGLMRVFLAPNKCKAYPVMHEIRKKGEK